MTCTRTSDTASSARLTAISGRGAGAGTGVPRAGRPPQPPAGSGDTSSGTAAANASANHTAGGSCSHEMSANATTPARLPAMFSV